MGQRTYLIAKRYSLILHFNDCEKIILLIFQLLEGLSCLLGEMRAVFHRPMKTPGKREYERRKSADGRRRARSAAAVFRSLFNREYHSGAVRAPLI